jgi:AbrB family looped-hinge helix DNA binding protein
METTRLSSKGQIIIPQAIRDAHHWQPGLNFTVMEMEEGILLKPVKAFKASSIQDVVGCTGYKGKKKTLDEMEAGIAQGVKDHDRD